MRTDWNSERQLIDDPDQVSINEEECTNRKSYNSAPVTLFESPQKLLKQSEDIGNKVWLFIGQLISKQNI